MGVTTIYFGVFKDPIKNNSILCLYHKYKPQIIIINDAIGCSADHTRLFHQISELER